MAVEVVMPKLGLTMKAGTVIEWLKKENDSVKKGEPIAEISSEKLQNQIEAPTDGTLIKIVVHEDQKVPVTTPLAYIGIPGEEVGGAAWKTEDTKEGMYHQTSAVKSLAAFKHKRFVISPAAANLAKSLHIDIGTVKGTGPNGRITKEDINRAAVEQMPMPKMEHIEHAAEVKKVDGMRKVIAERMHQSLQSTAQLTLMLKADVTEMLQLKKNISSQLNEKETAQITVTDFVAKAVIKALLDCPLMNSTYVDDTIHIHNEVHLGIAVALKEGLVVPVIRQAEKLSLGEISKQLRELTAKAREGKLDMEEMKGSTFTITNLGKSDVEYFTPILNIPESGILGVTKIRPDAVLMEGNQVERREMLPLSLTFDHRVLDGAPAGEFLAAIKKYLEKPYSLIL